MREHRVKPGKMNEEAIERARGDLASIFGSHDFRAIANGLLDTVDALDAEIAAARTMREESEGTFGRIAAALGFLGVALDPVRNAAQAPRISPDGASVECWVVRADEEQVIAQAVAALRE